MNAVVAEDRGDVRIVLLNRPERRNALDLDDRLALLQVLTEAMAGSRAVVLSGVGETFCAGGDLASMTADPAVARVRLDVGNELVRLLTGGPRPVVVAVEGGAHGLGLGLAGACDVVVAAHSAGFCTAFARVGLGPDTGVSASLGARVGPARARELLLSARTISTAEAVRLGLVDHPCEDGAALDTALAHAERLAAMSAPMVAGVKRLMSQADRSLDQMLADETRLQMKLLAGPEFEEGRSAFFDRRHRGDRGEPSW